MQRRSGPCAAPKHLAVPRRTFSRCLIKPSLFIHVKARNKQMNAMKKIFALAPFLLILMAGIVNAQNTPVVDERQQNQHARIRQGVASGEVTHVEAKRLRTEQRHVRRVERRAKADGEVTPQERAKLQRKQNRVSRDIRRQKHDPQDRPGAN